MAERQPFQYPDWCTGPVVDIEMPPGFPVCDYVTFTRPTYLHVMRKDPPDIDPPPFCPCIPTIDATFTGPYKSIATFGGTGIPQFNIKIVPVTEDCCNPEFKISFNIDVPCMPFAMAVTSKFTDGTSFADKPHLDIRHVSNTCKFEFKLQLPKSGGTPLELCLYEHGEGIKFVTCCSGVGYIGLDSTMIQKDMGTLSIALIQHINLKIPLLAALKEYSTGYCANELNDSDNKVYDPWGQECVWLGDSNENGAIPGDNWKQKYCCSKSKHKS